MSSRPRSAPFSTHARGVPLFDRGRFLDIPRHATNALLDLRDMASSAFWFLSMQSWLTFWSLLVNIFSVIFFTYYKEGSETLAVPLDFTLFAFTVVLPLIGFLWISYARRERCLSLLSEVKCLMTSSLAAHHSWIGAPASSLPAAQAAVASTISAMRAYFLPSRFYSRNYPYLGYKAAMIQIALDRARAQRVMRDSLAALGGAATAARAAGLAPSLEAILHERALRLAIAVDQLSNVKEFGTPQGVRSAARFYFCIIIPLFYGPYWAYFARLADFALAFFTSCVVQIALIGILNTASDLEDPFDNKGMDGIFMDEQLYEVEQALLATGADLATIEDAAGAAGAGRPNGAGGVPNGAAGGGAGGAGGGAGEVPPPPGGSTAPSRVVRVPTETV